MLNNSEVREYAKKSGVKLWEIAIRMNVSEPTITRKLRVELSDADKTAIIGHIDAIATEKAKEKAALRDNIDAIVENKAKEKTALEKRSQSIKDLRRQHMANAKKCDRCGKLYEIPRESHKIGVSRDTNKSGYNFMDLCPDCQSSLEDWIENKEAKEPAAPIYGVSGLTDKSTALTLTDDVEGMSFENDCSFGVNTSVCKRNTTTIGTQEVAAALCCSLATARQIMHRQDFPLIKAGKNLRVSLSAFENWLSQRKV